MTLIIAVTGRESIWLLADRRLSFPLPWDPKDDARKIVFLRTRDGVAILGYAGLGATANGTEPADWMNAVLRGRNYPLEQCLTVMSAAMQSQFPRHMNHLPGNDPTAHYVIVPAFVGGEARLYTISLFSAPGRKDYQFQIARHAPRRRSGATIPPRFAFGGSGGLILTQQKTWKRDLLRLLKAHDRGNLSARVVADHLASLNLMVHLRDNSVGPRCIVSWRLRSGGGAHQSYTAQSRDSILPSLPSIANGMDVVSLMGLTMETVGRDMMKSVMTGEPVPPVDTDEIKEKLARLPQNPDETFN